MRKSVQAVRLQIGESAVGGCREGREEGKGAGGGGEEDWSGGVELKVVVVAVVIAIVAGGVVGGGGGCCAGRGEGEVGGEEG